MLRRSLVFQFDQQASDAPADLRRRRARLTPIGTQAPHRSRMFYFRTAPIVSPTSDAETEFVIHARRHRPMKTVAATPTWTENSDASNSWPSNSGDTQTWTSNSTDSQDWTEN